MKFNPRPSDYQLYSYEGDDVIYRRLWGADVATYKERLKMKFIWNPPSGGGEKRRGGV